MFVYILLSCSFVYSANNHWTFLEIRGKGSHGGYILLAFKAAGLVIIYRSDSRFSILGVGEGYTYYGIIYVRIFGKSLGRWACMFVMRSYLGSLMS